MITEKPKISILSNIFNPVGPSARGGLEVFCFYLAKELEHRDEKVTLFASGDSEHLDCLVPLVDKSLQHSKSEQYLSDPWNYRKMTFEELAIYTKFISEFKNGGVIHFNLDDFMPIYLAVKSNLPMLTTMHLSPNSSAFKILPQLLNAQELNKAHLIGVSKKQVGDFKNYYKIIHHGVNLEDFRYSEKFRNSYLWLGRFVDQKGCADAIKAAKITKVNLNIGGEPGNKNELDYYNSNVKNELSAKIQLKGFLTGCARNEFYHGKATIFCSKPPEAFGLTILESMACGTPVIAYEVGAASEIIVEGKNGFLVKDNSPEGIVRAIKIIESMDKEKYLAMRKYCRQRVEENFSLNKMVNEYIETYAEIYQNWKNNETRNKFYNRNEK